MFSTRRRWLVAVGRVFDVMLELDEDRTWGTKTKSEVRIEDLELVALLDQLLAYVEEDNVPRRGVSEGDPQRAVVRCGVLRAGTVDG
jgi:hypothetical protein